MSKIKLESEDNQIFEIDLKIAKCFGIVKDMIIALGEDNLDTVIPVNVCGRLLAKAIAFATRHQNDPPIDLDEILSELTTEDNFTLWDVVFFGRPNNEMYELLEVATFLNYHRLTFVICKLLADLIRDQSPKEMRAVLMFTDILKQASCPDLDFAFWPVAKSFSQKQREAELVFAELRAAKPCKARHRSSSV